MKSGDESDEADAHDKDNSRCDLEAGSIIGVKPEHVVYAITTGSGTEFRGRSRGQTTATQNCGGSRGSARRSAERWGFGGGRRGGLRLRGTSRHGCGRSLSRTRRFDNGEALKRTWNNPSPGNGNKVKRVI
ncbi:hypothetical protein R6Q59_011741 [Mikania micrantha]